MSHGRWASAAFAVAAGLCACATSSDDPPPEPSSSSSASSSSGGTRRDSGVGTLDAASSCELGTAAHCGSCGVACAAGSAQTRAVCTDATSNGRCDVVCLGEGYDVDGKLENGCEAIDEPVQDTMTNAVAITLPDVVGDPNQKSNPYNLAATLYHDARKHDVAPFDRPLGREDWYKVTAVGAGSSGNTRACLGAVNFPSDNELEVCVSDNGLSSFQPAGCKLVMGGGTAQCVTANADAGTYYVRVRMTKAQTGTANKYSLYLEH